MFDLVIAVIFFVLIAFDSLYLGLIYRPFSRMIERVQGTPLRINWIGALVCYLALSAALYYFVILPNRGLKDAFILGVLIYTVYESVSYATLSRWDWRIGVIDSLWGGLLFLLSAWSVKRFYQ